jgi:hypothetical protein
MAEDYMDKKKEKAIGRKRRLWLEKDDESLPLSDEVVQSMIDYKPVANWEQSGSKPIAKREQTGSKPVANWEQTGSATGSTFGSNSVANWEQSGSKPIAKDTFSKLVGLQRNIIIFMYEECKKSRSKITNALTLEYIGNSLKCRIYTVKNAITRLEKKKCLIRVSFKSGRGGWSQYELPDYIYHDVIENGTGSNSVANREQTGSKPVAKAVAQPVANSSRRRRDIINTSSSNEDDDWNFDIALFEKFGFTKAQLRQLITVDKLSALEVYQSLIEFEHDVTHGTLPKINTTPINYLMGGLVKGSPYTSSAYHEEINRIAEDMNRKYEERKLKNEKTLIREWWESMNEAQQKEILEKMTFYDQTSYKIDGGIFADGVFTWLKDYYKVHHKSENG